MNRGTVYEIGYWLATVSVADRGLPMPIVRLGFKLMRWANRRWW